MSPEDAIAFGPCPPLEYLDEQPVATVRQGLHLAAESRHDGRAAFLRKYLYERTSVRFTCSCCGESWTEPPPLRATIWECPHCGRPVDTALAARRGSRTRRIVGALAGLVLTLGLASAPEPAAADEWTRGDTVRQLLFTTALAADWRQSREIARDPERNDYNPFLRDQDTARVDQYFAACALGHYLVARALPRPWREGWQLTWFVVELGTVHHNVRAGVRLQW